MLDWIIRKWEKNKEKLESAIRQDEEINDCSYDYLVKLVVHYILNNGDEMSDKYSYTDKIYWNENQIRMIEDGDCQGTQIFIIPRVTHQPDCEDYLFTYQSYGSCSGCDTLQKIQCMEWELDVACNYTRTLPTEVQVKDYALLCQHLISNMKWLGCEDNTQKRWYENWLDK